MKKEYCKKCGLPIPQERINKSNFCSDLCNLMPSNYNQREAIIYRDGYKHCLDNDTLLNNNQKSMRIFGKSYKQFLEAISEALSGKVILWATTKGKVAIIKWEEYDRLKNLDKQ